MKSEKMFSKLIVILLFLCSATYFQAYAGEEKVSLPGGTEVALPCPKPVPIVMSRPLPSPPAPIPNQTNPFLSDFFTPRPLPPAQYNGTVADRQLWDTFTWKLPSRCCQFLRGTLTIVYKPLKGGHGDQSPQAGDAGNDKLRIYSNGTQLLAVLLYPPVNFNSGGPWQTKTIPITPNMIPNNRLSFIVEDDTAVQSAKIDLYYCCLDVDCK